MATLTVDSGRPLDAVASALNQEYGWQVTFEEAPLVYANDMVDMTRNFSVGIRAYDPRGGALTFSYVLGADSRPTNARAVVQAAIDEHHRIGFPGKYEVKMEGTYLHIVPVGRLDRGGVWEQIASPLDTTVSVNGEGRHPHAVLTEMFSRVERDTGYSVVFGLTPFVNGMQPLILQEFRKVPARTVLRGIIQATGNRRVWYMRYWLKRNR